MRTCWPCSASLLPRRGTTAASGFYQQQQQHAWPEPTEEAGMRPQHMTEPSRFHLINTENLTLQPTGSRSTGCT